MMTPASSDCSILTYLDHVKYAAMQKKGQKNLKIETVKLGQIFFFIQLVTISFQPPAGYSLYIWYVFIFKLFKTDNAANVFCFLNIKRSYALCSTCWMALYMLIHSVLTPSYALSSAEAYPLFLNLFLNACVHHLPLAKPCWPHRNSFSL